MATFRFSGGIRARSQDSRYSYRQSPLTTLHISTIPTKRTPNTMSLSFRVMLAMLAVVVVLVKLVILVMPAIFAMPAMIFMVVMIVMFVMVVMVVSSSGWTGQRSSSRLPTIAFDSGNSQ
eukprot:518783-Amorphochlora_amoeboformis.AAC.1